MNESVGVFLCNRWAADKTGAVMLSAHESAAAAAVQPQKLKITAITDTIFDITQTQMDDLIEEL